MRSFFLDIWIFLTYGWIWKVTGVAMIFLAPIIATGAAYAGVFYLEVLIEAEMADKLYGMLLAILVLHWWTIILLHGFLMYYLFRDRTFAGLENKADAAGVA